jgi:hypothetical protein
VERQAACLVALCLLLTVGVHAASAAELSTGFTYQGRLLAGGAPANGRFDLRLALFSTSNGPNPIAPALAIPGVLVSNALFTTTVDFGPNIFDGSAYWMEVALRPSDTTAPFRTLPSRQRLSATPYALFAASTPWSGLTGLPQDFADGVDDNTTYTAGTGLSLNGTKFEVNFAGNGNSAAAARSDHTHSGQELIPMLLANDGSRSGLDADFLDGLDSSAFWRLDGNFGTVAGLNFLGTTDNEPLELKVNNQRALRLEPHAKGPNVIGGSSANSVATGIGGATIGGGGTMNDGSGAPDPNHVEAEFGVVGGGLGNRVAGMAASIGGGRQNAVLREAAHATIPGGYRASAGNYGQLAYASGSFSAPGDAQSSVYVLRNTTAVGAPMRELFLDGATQRMRVPPSGRWAFEVLIVAATPSGLSAGYSGRGVVENITGAATLVGGAFNVPPIVEEDQGWGAIVDVSGDALTIRVIGATSQAVRWVATVRTAELIF